MIVKAYYKGFLVEFDPSVIAAEKDIDIAKSFVDMLIFSDLKPSWNDETNNQALGVKTPVTTVPTTSQVDMSTNATCPIHGTPLVWKAGTSKTTNKPYGFWACPTRNADGSYCKGGSK